MALAAAGVLFALQGAPGVLAAPSKEPPRTELSHPCSRSISRLVRKQIENELAKPAQRAGHALWPEGCPFDAGVDLYGKHEKSKQRKRQGSQSMTWTCGLCGKAFVSEHYLDLHLERRHMNETPQNGVCLADYCELFEVCLGEQRRRTHRPPACDQEKLVPARARCEDAMRQCFPLDGTDVSRRLHAQMARQWCLTIDCRIREERRAVEDSPLMPVAVLMILIAMACLVFFGLVVCCVDCSDDIINVMQEWGLMSLGQARGLVRARDQARRATGVVDRTKNI